MGYARRRVLVAFGALAVVAACTAPADRVEQNYTVSFPSVAAAATTDTIEISVYAVKKPDDCQPIYERRRTGQELPRPVASTGLVKTCDVQAGNAGRLDVGFGFRAFLAVGRRGASEVLIGCEVRYVDDRASPPSVRMTLFDPDATLPPTDCKTLGDKCAGRCS